MKPAKVILFILLFTFTVGIFMVDVWDPDFWWHLATGKWIVEHGRLPDEDPFSFTTLQQDPYTAINRVRFILTQYWLAQIALFEAYSLFGFAGVSVVRALLLTLTIGFIALTLRSHKVPAVLILAIAALSVFIFRGFTGERPQLFSFLCAAVLLFLLERYRSSESGADSSEPGRSTEEMIHDSKLKTANRRYLWALPLLMALWSNLHGGYIYGVVIIAIYIGAEWFTLLLHRIRGRKETLTRQLTVFTAAGMIAVAATLLNPNTYHGIIDHLRYRPAAYFMSIQEMQPPHTLFKDALLYFGMLALVLALMLTDIIRRRKADIVHVSLFLFNAALSLSAMRFIPFFVISGSLLLGIYLQPFFPLRQFQKRKWLEVAALLTVALVIAAFSLFVEKISAKDLFRTRVNLGHYPYGSARFLKTLPPGKVFNPYTWGGYLIWNLYPGSQVFIDGRGLNEEIFLQYYEVTAMAGTQTFGGMPKWKAIIDSYHIDYLILAPLMEFASNWSLINSVTNDKDWKLVYADDSSLVFVRNSEKFSELIQKHSLPSDLAYATTAWQALVKAKNENTKEKKVEYYLIAADAFLRMNKTVNSRASINKVLELDPGNPTAKEYLQALGKE